MVILPCGDTADGNDFYAVCLSVFYICGKSIFIDIAEHENDIGFANLTKIVSRGFVDGFYYKPRVDHEVLEKQQR